MFGEAKNLSVRYSGMSDVGLKRRVNQDSILMLADKEEPFYLFVVADGMGGHADGEVASKRIVDGLWLWMRKKSLKENDFFGRLEDLKEEIKKIHMEIYTECSKEKVCGSTLVGMMIYGDAFASFSIGDSHIYRYKKRKIESLLKDDVWENMSDIREKYSEAEIANHRNRGKLTNSVGSTEKITINVATDLLDQGDRFLICSDGLYKYANEKDIARSLAKVKNSDLITPVANLVSSAYTGGAKDNVSVIIVSIE